MIIYDQEIADNLIELLEITLEHVVIKFSSSIKVSTISQDSVLLFVDGATPSQVFNPFDDFNAIDNYNSISRTLKIYWNQDILEASTDYYLTVTGLKNAASELYGDVNIQFATSALLIDTPPPPSDPPIPTIEDHSIIKTISYETDSATPIDETLSLNFVSSDPDDGAYWIDEDYNNGRIAITFSIAPSLDKVSSAYFKAFKKEIKQTPTKWERVDVVLSVDASSPIVYIDFPPDGATPASYFEQNFEYKVIVSPGLSD